jgi:hypothetical protein
MTMRLGASIAPNLIGSNSVGKLGSFPVCHR